MYSANLEEADLSNANLQKAYLVNANLRHTVLTGANLAGATILCDDIKHAIFDKNDLKGFKCKVESYVPPIIIPPKSEAEKLINSNKRIRDSSDNVISEE